MNVTSILVRDYEKKSPLLPKRKKEVHLEKNAQIFQAQRDLEQGIRERPSANIQKDTSLLNVSNVSFQDEYRSFFKKYKIKFDEKYVWD